MLREAIRSYLPHRSTVHDGVFTTNDAEMAYRHERLSRQLHLYDEVFSIAENLGVADNTFVLGGVGYPWLRDARLHGDIDVLLQGKEQCSLLTDSMLSSGKFIDSGERLLRGSCMKYFLYTQEPGCGPVEVRYVEPDVRNGVPIWTHELPGWVEVLLGNKPIIIPDSAFSDVNERLPVGQRQARFVRPEYSYLIKQQSPYSKDKIDAALLEEVIDSERAESIARDIEIAEARLTLPHPLMTIIRSFQCFGDGLNKDQYNHLLNG